MNFRKGLPPGQIAGDYRGPYGIGRRAHGSDPNAQYCFGEDAKKRDPGPAGAAAAEPGIPAAEGADKTLPQSGLFVAGTEPSDGARVPDAKSSRIPSNA